jgi:MFS family permease
MEATAPQTAPDPRRWWALALLCGAFFMVILDAAIVTITLPSIEKQLEFSAQGLQWVVSACALTFAGLLLLGGARPTCSAVAASSWSVSRSSPWPRCSADSPGRTRP